MITKIWPVIPMYPDSSGPSILPSRRDDPCSSTEIEMSPHPTAEEQSDPRQTRTTNHHCPSTQIFVMESSHRSKSRASHRKCPPGRRHHVPISARGYTGSCGKEPVDAITCGRPPNKGYHPAHCDVMCFANHYRTYLVLIRAGTNGRIPV